MIFVTNVVTNSFKKYYVASEFDFFYLEVSFLKWKISQDLTEIPVEVLELDFVEELNLSENQVST